MVKTEAYEGDETKNPYLFHHYDMQSVSLMVNNYFQPYAPIRCEFGPALSNSSQLYRNLFDIFQKGEETIYNGITAKDFVQGTTLMAFRLGSEKEGIVAEKEI